MPHNAFWGRSAGQVNVTRAGFAVSYFVSHTCWQPLPQRVNSVNANDGTAAGIYALRRLKFKRCGELASRLSSRLTFAWGCVAVRAIHSSRCISAGLLVNFIEVRIFSVVVHANHLTVETLLQILVGMVPRAGPLISAAPDSQGIATDICSGILTVR